MNRISCDVCMDLIPLVKDDIASNDSRLIVEEHIKSCEKCNIIYNGVTQIKIQMDDMAVVNKIKKQISYALIAIILVGSVFGMMLTNSMDMFYNALIMPAIGGLGYVLLKKKAVLLPFCLFAFSTVWHTAKLYLTGEVGNGTGLTEVLLMSVFYSMIYAFFNIIGILITWLLQYAFGRENK